MKNTVKMTNEKMIKDLPGLAEISKKTLPIKASYAIAKNISKINDELKVYTKERQKLIDEYAEKDEKGVVKADKEGHIIFKEGCKEKWDKDIKELLAIESDIEIRKFNINDLSLNGFSMTPAELMTIDYMIEG